MSKLSKTQAKAHAQAVALLANDSLTYEEREFVLQNWQESANHVNGTAGAFFTPFELAASFSIEVCYGGERPPRILDLCAGIGGLSFHLFGGWGAQPEVTCVEINPDYVEVGRKVVPNARWIVSDVFDLPADLGHFDFVIGNPPFGRTPRGGKAPRYSGAEFEYQVIDLASDLGDHGVFIVPQQSAPFRYSGEPYYTQAESDAYRRFRDQTKIEMGASCGIDTDFARKLWRGTAPKTEIVTCDFQDARDARAKAAAPLALVTSPLQPALAPAQLDLFAVAA